MIIYFIYRVLNDSSSAFLSNYNYVSAAATERRAVLFQGYGTKRAHKMI